MRLLIVVGIVVAAIAVPALVIDVLEQIWGRWFVLSLIGIVVLSAFILSNISVWRANRFFYNELLNRGCPPVLAKRLMKFENERYAQRIKSGEKGLTLAHHLKAVLNSDYRETASWKN